MSDLNALHQAISASIEAAMPQLATVGSYAVVQQETPLPALFHGIVDLETGHRLPVMVIPGSWPRSKRASVPMAVGHKRH